MIPKSFLKISFVGIGNVINAALGFLFIAAVAKVLSVEDFGKYALLSTLLVSVAKITDFGTNNLYVAQSIKHDKSIINTFLSLKLILFLVSIPIGLIFLFVVKLNDINTLGIFLLGLTAYMLNFALFGIFQKLEKYAYLIGLNFIPASIKGIFAVMILTGLVTVNFEQTFLIFTASVVPSLILYFRLPTSYKKFALDFSETKPFLKKSSPAGVSQLITEGWSAVSNTIAKITGGFLDVGYFSLADKISSIFSLVSLSIFTVLLPKNALLKKEKKGYDYFETMLLSGGVIVLSILAIIFAQFFIPAAFGNKFSQSLILVDLLIIAGAITAIQAFMENFFFIEEQTEKLLQISVTRLLIFLSGSFVLIPMFQIKGLAYAQIISALAALCLTLFFFRKVAK